MDGEIFIFVFNFIHLCLSVGDYLCWKSTTKDMKMAVALVSHNTCGLFDAHDTTVAVLTDSFCCGEDDGQFIQETCGSDVDVIG